jgi:hypothetical protein
VARAVDRLGGVAVEAVLRADVHQLAVVDADGALGDRVRTTVGHREQSGVPDGEVHGEGSAVGCK